MVRLSFKKVYEKYIVDGTKRTTCRLGDKSNRFKVGDKVDIVTGSRYNQKIVKSTIIKSVFKLPVSSVNDYDLQYESPDCRTKEGLRCVMYHINNKILSNDDIVTLITWE